MEQSSLNIVARNILAANTVASQGGHLGASDMGASIPSTSPTEALHHIESNYAKIQSDWASVEKDEGEINSLQSHMHWEQSHIHRIAYTTFGDQTCGTYISQTIQSEFNKNEAKVESLNNAVTPLVQNIESLDASLSIKSLLSALEQVNLGFSLNSNSDYTYIETQVQSQDPGKSTQVESALDVICAMVTQQIAIDKDLQEGQVANNPDADTDILEAIQLQGIQGSELTNFESSLTNLQTATSSAINNENYAITHHSAASMAFGTDTGAVAREKKRIATDKIILNTITTVEAALSSFTANVQNRAFSNITQTISAIVGKMKALLADTKIPPSAKMGKLAVYTQLLLGFLQTILQVAENIRSKNQVAMDKANLQTQNLNMQTFVSDAQDIKHMQEIQSSLSILKEIMTVINVVAISICFLSGNVAAGVALTTMEIMNATGATKDLTDDITKGEHSEVAGNITVGAITMAITLAGGAVVNQILDKIASQIALFVQESEGLVSSEIENLIQEALDAQAEEVAPATATEDADASTTAAAAAPSTATADASAAIQAAIDPTVDEQIAAKAEAQATKLVDADFRKLVAQTQKMAARNAVEQFYKETSTMSFSRIRALIQASFSKTPDAELTKYVAASMNAAAKDAVQKAAELTETDLLAKPIEEQIEAIAKESASCADSVLKQGSGYIAETQDRNWFENLINKDLSKVKKAMTKMEKATSTQLAKSFKKASSAVTVVTMSQNSSMFGTSQGAQIASGLATGLGQAMAVGTLSGIMDIIASGKGGAAMSILLTVGSVMTTCGQGVSAISDIQQGRMLDLEASSEKGVALSQAFNSFLNELSSRSQDLSPTASPFQAEERTLRQQQLWLAAHQWDGINEGCKVLAAQSV